MKINKFTTLAASIILAGTTSVFGCDCEVCPPDKNIQLYVDIHPTSCPNPLNVKSRGLVPAAFLGTATKSVDLVNPLDDRGIIMKGVNALGGTVVVKAVKLAYEDVSTPYGTTPTPQCDGDEYSCTEDGPDGIGDLSLKFPMQGVNGHSGVADILKGYAQGTVHCIIIQGWTYPDAEGKTYKVYGKDVIIIK